MPEVSFLKLTDRVTPYRSYSVHLMLCERFLIFLHKIENLGAFRVHRAFTSPDFRCSLTSPKVLRSMDRLKR